MKELLIIYYIILFTHTLQLLDKTFRISVFLLERKQLRTLRVLSEEILNNKRARLEASPQKSLRLLCQEASVPKPSLNAARKLLLLKA
jgi:hypothetical protein